MELVNVAFIAIFIFPLFLEYVVEAGSCPSHHSHTGTTDDQICLRYVLIEMSLNNLFFAFCKKLHYCRAGPPFLHIALYSVKAKALKFLRYVRNH